MTKEIEVINYKKSAKLGDKINVYTSIIKSNPTEVKFYQYIQIVGIKHFH